MRGILRLLAALSAGMALLSRRLYRHLREEQRRGAELREQLERVEAEALRLQTARRDFVANISHELRTPLASIKLLVETLEGGALHDDAVAAEFIHRIGQETDHLISMAEELLELARLESAPSLQPARRDPAELAREAVERMGALALERGVTLLTDLAPELPDVWADPVQISRVFVNLLNNALAFTPKGGTVTISARMDGALVAFGVRDTGPGIPAGEEQRIFERFYKLDPARGRGGTGLGLSIARHIVKAQGGQIWACNHEDGGACFSFTLPLTGDSSDRA